MTMVRTDETIDETMESVPWIDEAGLSGNPVSQSLCILDHGSIKQGRGGVRAGAGRPRLHPLPIPIAGLGIRWYVAETFPQAERHAVQDLARFGWEAYLPLTAVWRPDPITPTQRRKHVIPLMPSIVFVRFDAAEATWGSMLDDGSRFRVKGLRSIIRGAGGRPAPVSARRTDAAWTVECFQADDARRLELSSARGEARLAGATVEVVVAGLGVRGVVASCDGYTTVVTVALFGRDTPVPMSWDQVRAV
jgi:hypothetical protein